MEFTQEALDSICKIGYFYNAESTISDFHLRYGDYYVSGV